MLHENKRKATEHSALVPSAKKARNEIANVNKHKSVLLAVSTPKIDFLY